MACETNLTANEVDSVFLPDGYSAFQDDKCSAKHGVLIAYKQNLIMSKIEVSEKTCGLVLAKLQVLGRPDLYVGSFYRHTNSDPASIRALSEDLLAIMGKERPNNFVLAGDFNLPSVNWETSDISPSPRYGREVNKMALDMCNDLFLTQMVEETTRGRNILDLMFVSSPDLVSSVETKAGIIMHD